MYVLNTGCQKSNAAIFRHRKRKCLKKENMYNCIESEHSVIWFSRYESLDMKSFRNLKETFHENMLYITSCVYFDEVVLVPKYSS